MEHAGKVQSPHSAVILFQLGGAMGQYPEDYSAAGNRDAKFVLNIAGAWDQAEADDANIGWARTAWSDMKTFSTGGNYVNFLTADETPDRIDAAIGKAAGRLAEVKAKWDPDNVFRTNRNIRPVTSTGLISTMLNLAVGTQGRSSSFSASSASSPCSSRAVPLTTTLIARSSS
jgi:hypothetical protein